MVQLKPNFDLAGMNPCFEVLESVHVHIYITDLPNCFFEQVGGHETQSLAIDLPGFDASGVIKVVLELSEGAHDRLQHTEVLQDHAELLLVDVQRVCELQFVGKVQQPVEQYLVAIQLDFVHLCFQD